MNLFSGYIKLTGKTPIASFTNKDDLFTFDEVYESIGYGGVLSVNTVMVDIDDFEESELLLKIIDATHINCCVLKTSRGRHFYFKNDGTIHKNYVKTKTAIGVSADIKIGKKNSYAALKVNGKERLWEIECDDVDQVPLFLLPVNTKVELINMTEGDGRNDKLFRYIIDLQKAKFTKDEIKYIFRLINEYVFVKKLKEKELATICRDEAFLPTGDGGEFFDRQGKFKFYTFALYLIETLNILKINEQIHIYDDGIYVQRKSIIDKKMIEIIPTLNRNERAETYAYIEASIPDNSPLADSKFIAFKNGIYDIEQKTIINFTPDIILINKINFDYDDLSYSHLADDVLLRLSCGDNDIKNLLEEIIGYCFYRRNELRKIFILLGGKENGKSTFLDMLANLLGEENISSLDINNLGDRFKTAEIAGKLANIGDDISDEFIRDPAIIKKAASGDLLTGEKKGKDPFQFRPYAKHIYSANAIPRIKDKSGAVLSRMIIVPFTATFNKNSENYDPYIKYKLRENDVMEHLIVVGLKGLIRVLKNQSFSTSKKIEKELIEYEENNNPILLFFKEISVDEIVGVQTKFVYHRYCEFCINSGYQPMSSGEFCKVLRGYYEVEIKVTKDKERRSVRIYGKTIY